MLFINQPPLPEITDGLSNTHPGGLPIFPIMFVSIACGAISGFHATQSPLMARCMKSEKYARPVFYGAMITEGIVALIWAAAATYFFHNNGMEENNAAVVVDSITERVAGRCRRCISDTGCDSSSDYFWRYGFPLGSSDCRRLPAYGAKNAGQTSDDLYTHVYRCDRNLII